MQKLLKITMMIIVLIIRTGCHMQVQVEIAQQLNSYLKTPLALAWSSCPENWDKNKNHAWAENTKKRLMFQGGCCVAPANQ